MDGQSLRQAAADARVEGGSPSRAEVELGKRVANGSTREVEAATSEEALPLDDDARDVGPDPVPVRDILAPWQEARVPRGYGAAVESHGRNGIAWPAADVIELAPDPGQVPRERYRQDCAVGGRVPGSEATVGQRERGQVWSRPSRHCDEAATHEELPALGDQRRHRTVGLRVPRRDGAGRGVHCNNGMMRLPAYDLESPTDIENVSVQR